MKPKLADEIYNQGTVLIAGRTINVEVADTQEKKNLGLSGRTGLSDEHGMWFVYDEEKIPNFWMKDMEFPIDIIWIHGHKIVDITPNIQPEPGVGKDNLKRYKPNSPITRVLEVHAGWADKFKVQIGDNVEFHKN